jgi:hypothetical protein
MFLLLKDEDNITSDCIRLQNIKSPVSDAQNSSTIKINKDLHTPLHQLHQGR